jgi:hypothetical protein
MEKAQFGSSPDPPKKVLVSAWEWVGDTCTCVYQQKD